MKKIIKIVTLLLVLNGCSSENKSVNSCNETNSTFNQLYNSVVLTHFDGFGYAREVHSYNFEVLSNKTICKIGYQSRASMSTVPYLIEIIDNTSNTTLYSENNIFSSTSTSYIAITPILLTVGHSYTIKRIQVNWGSNFGDPEGRVVSDAVGDINFPITYGELRITGGASYDLNNPVQDNQKIPYIDLVFEN